MTLSSWENRIGFMYCAPFCNSTWALSMHAHYECIYQEEKWEKSCILNPGPVRICWACMHFYSAVRLLTWELLQSSAVSFQTAPLDEFGVNYLAQGHPEGGCWGMWGAELLTLLTVLSLSLRIQWFSSAKLVFTIKKLKNKQQKKKTQPNSVRGILTAVARHENMLKIQDLIAKIPESD